MISTALTLIDPVQARILVFYLPPLPFSDLWISYPLTDGILLALIVAERRQAKGRAAFPIMLSVFLIVQILSFVLPQGLIWHRFAG